jgi:isoamylase
MKHTRLEQGRPHPMGASLTPEGINFAVFSEDADAIILCLFDDQGRETQLELPERTFNIFHGFLPGGRTGQRYGFRAQGAYRPAEGLRFNHNKLLLDPYARDWTGDWALDDRDFAYTIGSPEQDFAFDARDNGATAPKSLVKSSLPFDWGNVQKPRTPMHQTVIYEAHVRGLTKLHPDLPENLRGTYLGVSHPKMIEHYHRLGVTAIELLPVHSIFHDRRLRELKLRNYWGYGSMGYFRPEPHYANLDDPTLGSSEQQFKMMVRQLHQAGLEVFLDVVYNHTGEGSHLGPTLSMRGLCNRSYYRAQPDNPRFYLDYSGCGNTLNIDNPQVLQWVMDSLRYWVEEMGVDGFRYDLATALARHRSSFLDTIHQDPTLKEVKLIAEPWDLGEGGYQAGNFPIGWSEWNDRYRDTIRRFWKGDMGQVPQLATRLTGSGDLFWKARRGPTASINFVTCHDGFCLRDLVSYDHKHNELNLENNQDGSNSNWSSNHGVEGPSSNRKVEATRLRQMKNLLGTLFFSHGVPMLLAGDEVGRTQSGNNNAYCQDNSLSWIDWEVAKDPNSSAAELLRFASRLGSLRDRFPILRLNHPVNPEQCQWFAPQGYQLKDKHWNEPALKSLVWALGKPAKLLLVLNASAEAVDFSFPDSCQKGWTLELSSVEPQIAVPTRLEAQSLRLYSRR